MATEQTVERTIVHAPHGAGSPYFFGMEERTPRDPVGGDMVGIGFLTIPGRAAGAVALHWSRNGRRQPPIGGRVLARQTDYDRWLAEIGVVEAGDRVEYWVVAEIGGRVVESPCYGFVARRWRQLAACPAVAVLADGLQLATLDREGTPGPALSIRRLDTAGALQLDLGNDAGAATLATAGPVGPSIEVESGMASLVVDSGTGRLCLRPQPDAPELPLRLRWLEEGDGRLVGLELTGALHDDERLVGFGERFNALDQRGRMLDSVVYEQYKN